MKKKELVAYRKKQIEDLFKILSQKKKDMDEAFLKIRAGQEKNVRSVKIIRRDISQILTIIREKEIITPPADVGSEKENTEEQSKTKK